MTEKFTLPNFLKKNLGGFIKNLIPISIIIAGLAIAGAVVYINQSKVKEAPGTLSSQAAGEKVIEYINQNILQGRATSSLMEIKEESGLYKLKLKIGEEEFDLYMTKDGKFLFPEAIDLEIKPATQEERIPTIGNFFTTKDEICKEDGKPIIYFFGSTGCPHCQWEHPIVEAVAKDFEEDISFHNNMDSSDDSEVFRKYSEGGVPTTVIGCRYFRVGSGERTGKEEEVRVLTALICKLTENKPADVCSKVQDLIAQI